MSDEAPEPVTAEAEPPAPDPVKLQQELQETKKRSEDLLTRLQYLQAEFENSRKRAEREVEQAVRRANEGLVARLLSVLDDLDAAVATAKGKAGKGLALVRENVLKALGEFGLEEIPADGVPFDPYVHECVQRVDDDSVPDGHVKEVVRRGYSFQKKVLRPAQVVVATRAPSQEKSEGETDA